MRTLALLLTLLVASSPLALAADGPAFFMLDKSSPLVGERIEADASASGAGVFAWRWDENATYEPGPVAVTHTYNDPGAHIVGLSVTRSDGSTSFANQTVLVRAGAPTAYIQPDVYEPGGATLRLVVNASFSTPSKGATRITRYSWDWGEGEGVFEGNATEEHTFLEPGVYTVTLRVTDDLGRESKVVTYQAVVKSTFLTRMGLVWKDRASFVEGARVTLILAVGTTIVGFALAIVLALMRISRMWFLRWPALAYIEVIRGTPLFLQILITWLVLPYMGLRLSVFYAGALALVVNTIAYQAEAIRAGIQAIPTGQMEAAISLGMSYMQAMRRIIIPQAFRLALPALANEFIILLKDTSLVSAIGVVELTFIGRAFANRTFLVVEPFLAVGLVYFVMTYTLSTALRRLERKLAIPGMGLQGAGV